MSNDKLIESSTLTIQKDLQAGFLALLVKFDFAIPCKSNYALVHALLPKDLEDFIQPVTRSTSSTTTNKKENGKDAEGINLYRVWLASFIPDGFWPQLLTRIISDDRINSILSDFLSIPLNKSRYLSSDVSSLCQKGFSIHYDQTKLLELKEVSNEIKNFTNKLNLSEKYATQIELTIYTSQIAALRNAYQKLNTRQNFIRLASKFLVVIEQHILDIGEEWFPGTFYDTCSNSYVPCPVCSSQGDNCIFHSDNANDPTHQFLCFGGVNTFCFSARDLLDAYATQSRSINCPTHKELFVKEIAPDMVRN